jgi:ribosomal-protein-alanine N-acetyltransferase
VSDRELATERLLLRPFALEDLDALAAIYGDPVVMHFIGKGARTREETRSAIERMQAHWARERFGMWAAVERRTGVLAGRVGLQRLDGGPEVELGYILARSFWGTGLATEAGAASLRFGFEEAGLERVVAIANPANGASRRVMEKLGFRYEKDAHFYATDVVYYALGREAWRAARAGAP